ncbi:MAG: Csu type fimbrial protein [Thermoanaerobaculia bacterium]
MTHVKASLIVLAAMLAGAASARANCQWNTAPTDIVFGAYSVFSPAAVTAVSNFEVRCNPQTTATIRMSRGTQSMSFNPRSASNGSESIDYNLFQDAAGSQIWGDGTSGTFTATVEGTPKVKDFAFSIFGRAFPAQDAAAGMYTDTITVSVEYSGNQSGTLTTTVQVLVEVLAECQSTGTSLDFGTYEPIGANATAPKTAASTLVVYCTRGTTASIGLTDGFSPSGVQRRMSSGVDFLAYGLYSDSGTTSPWTTTTPVPATSNSKFVPLEGGLTIYGSIPPAQDVSVGSYQDTVQAVINY